MTEESATGAVEIMVWAAKTATRRLAFGPAPGSPAAEAYTNGYYDRLASLMDRANAGDGAAAEVLSRFFAAGESESENDDAPNQPPQATDDAPPGEGGDAGHCRERRLARRPTFRDHLLATTRHTWPALAHSKVRSIARWSQRSKLRPSRVGMDGCPPLQHLQLSRGISGCSQADPRTPDFLVSSSLTPDLPRGWACG
jgi:hypothetical protein